MSNKTFFEQLAKFSHSKRAIILNGQFKGIEIFPQNYLVEQNTHYKKLHLDSLDYIYNLLENQNKTEIINTELGDIFIEIASLSPRLIILGGGHISIPLSAIGKMCDFEVIVIDDRVEFANNNRFPDIDRVICCDFNKVYKYINPHRNDYFVIVTRGHINDEECLETIIDKDNYTYLGMIGSKTKVSLMMKNMENKGYSKDILSKIYAPIGLKIGGQSPGEIAVSIGAQIIQEKNKFSNELIEKKLLTELVVNKHSGILCTIIEKKGSSPRGVGSKMLVKSDGIVVSTIGGGSLEHEVIKTAFYAIKNQSTTKFFYEEFILSNEESSDLGMICGGKIKVLFENI